MKGKTKTRIKICGIQNEEELGFVARSGVDAVGFLTEVPVNSPRKLDSERAAALVRQVPKTLNSVMVIMPENSARALELIEKVRPDIVQIHSALPLSELEAIRKKTDIPIIKSFSVPVEAKAEIQKGVAFRLIQEIYELEASGIVDALLLDSGVAGKAGGTGCPHDWTFSREIAEKTELPLILAGGLKPENVGEAIKAVGPYAVDTASGVESEGAKDERKIREFIEEVRCSDAFL